MRLRREKGSVAVIALWAVVILAFLAISLGQGVRQKIVVFQRLSAGEEARQASESAFKNVVSRIQEMPRSSADVYTGSEWYAGTIGAEQVLPVGRVRVRFTVEDENSRVNVNAADIDSLAALFQGPGRMEASAARRLAAEVIDFRDPDDYVTGDGEKGGSERGAYRQARLEWGPKNADFEFPGELLRVKGMTKEVYNFVRKYITIYGNGRLNLNHCPAEALRASGISPSLAEKLIALRAGPDRREGTADDVVFADVQGIPALFAPDSLSDDEKESLRHAVLHGVFCVSPAAFRVTGKTEGSAGGFSSSFTGIYSIREGLQFWAEN